MVRYSRYAIAMFMLVTAGALNTGCSTSRMAVGAMVPVLDNARDAAMASDDVKTFRDAAPANLFLLEGLIGTDPDNVDLRINASMLYFSYAFAFVEDEDPGYASLLYRKGMAHGREALLRQNKKIARDWSVRFDDFASTLPELKEKDAPAAVWTSANWAQFISIHLDSTAILRDIPKATSLLDRTAELDGAFFEGLPYIMIGSLHAFRPQMMGGSPEKSLENFEKASAASQHNMLLGKVFFARFYCYRIQDAELFEKTLREVIATPLKEDDPYRMLNLIAKNKATKLLGEIDDMF